MIKSKPFAAEYVSLLDPFGRRKLLELRGPLQLQWWEALDPKTLRIFFYTHEGSCSWSWPPTNVVRWPPGTVVRASPLLTPFPLTAVAAAAVQKVCASPPPAHCAVPSELLASLLASSSAPACSGPGFSSSLSSSISSSSSCSSSSVLSSHACPGFASSVSSSEIAASVPVSPSSRS